MSVVWEWGGPGWERRSRLLWDPDSEPSIHYKAQESWEASEAPDRVRRRKMESAKGRVVFAGRGCTRS